METYHESCATSRGHLKIPARARRFAALAFPASRFVLLCNELESVTRSKELAPESILDKGLR